MSTIKSISIDKPCQQPWEGMATAAEGRYCAQCCKTVTDFTVMNNVEVIDYIRSNANVCGRFDKGQLLQLNNQITPRADQHYPWKKILAAASLISVIPSTNVKAEAKHQSAMQQFAKKKEKNKSIQVIDPTSQILLKGHVIAKDDTLPIPGIRIYLNDNTLSTSADMHGDFKLLVPSNADSLVFSFIGYKTQKVKIGQAPDNFYAIVMEPDPTKSLREVVVGEVSVRYSFIHRLWHRIKRIF